MKRLILFLGCLLLVVTGGIYFLSLRGARIERETRLKAAPKITKSTTRNVQLIPGPVIRPERQETPETKTEQPSDPRSEPARSVETAKAATPRKTTSGAKAPLQDPIARAALSEVGFNQEAEEYWLAAINDPSLSDHERQDLIEDLNEEGFDDPKNLTADDLPLIMRRIELIETYAPDAMDDVNAAAFQEAYKDLMNMFAKVAGL